MNKIKKQFFKTSFKAVRIVITTNGANTISIIIPCRRVMGSNNDLAGYAGGYNIKNKLLNLESCDFIEKLIYKKKAV